MKILAIRIGDKYGPEYETYLQDKLPEYDFIWIREPYDKRVLLQWNKMYGMNLDIDEPICVIDIDMLLVNDYKKAFEYPIKPGQFLAMPGWWRDTETEGYKINGGFFKYYPKDCKYIYDKFMSNIDYWQNYYIKKGITKGPVNGEQYFVEDSVKEKLQLITLPDSWVTRWCANDEVIYGRDMMNWQVSTSSKYKLITNNDYVYLGGEFHPDIKIVHFTHTINKPHEWKDYKKFNNIEKKEYYVNSYKNAKEPLIESIENDGGFDDINFKEVMKDFTFYEFTLEELGLPSADNILKNVKQIEKEVGLQGWKTANGEAKRYKGFSLSYNSEYIDKDVSIHHQTWGSNLQTQTFSRSKGTGFHKELKNSYYDSYAFRKMPSLINNNLQDVFNKLNMGLVRSRAAYFLINAEDENETFKNSWHTDEFPYFVLRINIPLQTTEEHIIKIKGEDPYGNKLELDKHLEVGKAYIWNTKIPHCFSVSKECKSIEPRIHLVLGLSCYFNYNENKDCFIRNDVWGKNMKDIVLSKSFINKGKGK